MTVTPRTQPDAIVDNATVVVGMDAVGIEVVDAVDAVDTVAADRVAMGESVDIAVRLVVSPVTGRFQEPQTKNVTCEGELVDVGDEIGTVGTAVIRAPIQAWLMGVMVLPGELVRAGQPVAWLRPL